jgi:serpin B
MNRRHFVALLALPAIAELLQACGTDADTPRTNPSPADSSTGPTVPASTVPGSASTVPATTVPATTAPAGAQSGLLVKHDVPRAAAAAGDAGTAAAAVDAFGADLYTRLVAAAGDGNVVFSPASILVALAMVSAGARGDTLTQLDRALHVADPGTIHQAVNSLSIALAARNAGSGDDQTTLEVTNSLWAQKDLQFVDAFLDTLAAEYGTGAYTVDYKANPEAARAAINAWVDDATQARIPALLAEGSITVATRLTLVNAIYMKARWQSEFDEQATTDAPFTTAAGAVVQAKTMHHTGSFAYAAADGWRAIDLPYEGSGLTMTVIVPDAETTPVLADVLAALAPTRVDLGLPRLDFANTTALVTTLQALGVTAAFDAHSADFSGITTTEPLVISDVVHQANITVDEHGTEAAAATAVILRPTAAPAPGGEPIELIIDRPFVFVVRDVPTGAVLFLGRVTDPTSGGATRR